MYYLTAEAAFDAAHFLAGHGGKCKNLHGHRWRIVARIAGLHLQTDGAAGGMLLDFSDFKRAVHALADRYDHSFVVQEGTLRAQTIEALQAEGFAIVTVDFRPTAEHLAKHLFDALRAEGFPVCAMTVYETPDNCAMYEEDL